MEHYLIKLIILLSILVSPIKFINAFLRIDEQKQDDTKSISQFEDAARSITSKWDNFDIKHAIPTELHDYKNDLYSLIHRLEKAIEESDRIKLAKFAPVSSVLLNMKAGYMLRRLENLKSQAAGSPTQISSLIEIEESSGELVNKNSEKLLPINDNSINEENKELPTDSSESEIYDTNNVLADSVFENSNIISTIQSPETSKSHEDLSFSTTPTAATNVLRTEATHSTTTTTITTSSPSPTTATPNEEEIIEQVEQRSSSSHLSRSKTFNPKANHTKEECFRLTQSELINELKQKGTYNPDLMAWDASGLLRFLDRSISDQYERRKSSHPNSEQTVMRNVEALEKILLELDLKCDVRQPEVISKLQNLTIHPPRRSVASPTIRMNKEEIRSKRSASLMDTNILKAFNQSRLRDNFDPNYSKGQKIIGEVYIVPFGCDKRGEEEDGYLRLCGACQAIRKLPDNFFPPFINEVMCDEDKSCLYINDFPHGRCNQKYMNFVVLKNVGTDDCQIWQKFNLNVRVSCECFIRMTSLSKTVGNIY